MLDKFIYHKIRELSQSVCLCAFSFLTFYCEYERETVGVRETDKERKWASSHHGTYVKVRGQLTGVLSFYHGVLGLNTGYQACWQVPSPTKPSDWPKNALIAPPFQAILLPVSWWNRWPLICSWSNKFITKQLFLFKETILGVIWMFVSFLN